MHYPKWILTMKEKRSYKTYTGQHYWISTGNHFHELVVISVWEAWDVQLLYISVGSSTTSAQKVFVNEHERNMNRKHFTSKEIRCFIPLKTQHKALEDKPNRVMTILLTEGYIKRKAIYSAIILGFLGWCCFVSHPINVQGWCLLLCSGNILRGDRGC